MRIHYQRGKFFASIITLTDGSNVYDVHVEGTGQFVLFNAVDEADAITRVNALDAALSEEADAYACLSPGQRADALDRSDEGLPPFNHNLIR